MLEVKRKALPKSVRIAVYQKCNGHCAYCGCDLQYKDMQVDHVIPLNGCEKLCQTQHMAYQRTHCGYKDTSIF